MKKHLKFFLSLLSLTFFAMFLSHSLVPLGWNFLETEYLFGNIDLNPLIASAGVGAVAFADINWDNNDNMGGFTTTAHLLIFGEILTPPVKTTTPTTDTHLAVLTGNYIMRTGRRAYTINVPPNSLGFDAESQGEPGSHSFLQKGTFFIKGTTTTTIALARKLNNQLAIILVRDPNTREHIQIGCFDHPLILKPKLSAGQNPTDKRGLTVDYECSSPSPAWIYTGTIPLTPAV